MLPLILTVLLGSGLGAALGYFGQCSSGACPLTANWKRGALFGAALGFMFHVGSGGLSTYRPPKHMKAVSSANFEAEVLQERLPVLVDFYAPWCGPCKAMSPALDQVAGEMADRMKFVQVNIDQAPEVARRFDVSAVPTLLVVKAGQVVDRMVGAQTADALRRRLAVAIPAAVAPPAGS